MTAAGADPVDAKMEWLRFYCARQMKLLPVYEMTPDGRCACGEAGCRERDWAKHPRINWGAGATYNLSLVESWHRRWPNANWAWALEAHFTVDLDPRNGGWTGDELYEAWGNTLGFELPATLRADSGGGGTHLVFQQPEGDPVRNGHLVLPDGRPLRGTDIKGSGGYILVHPSNHRSGGVYRWHEPWVDPAPAPPELLELIRRKAQRAVAGQPDAGVERANQEAAGGFDINRWITEGAGTPPGYQHDHLVRGIGWLIHRGRKRNELIAMASVVAESYPTGDPDNPWTTQHVIELVTDMQSRYQPTLSGSIPIPNYTPVSGDTPTGPAGGGGDEVTPLPGGDDGGDGSFRLTHSWVKDRFIEAHGDFLRWTDAMGWFTWRGTRWERDEHEVHRRIERFLLELQEDVQHQGLDPQPLNAILRQIDGWLAMGPIKSLDEMCRRDLSLDAESFDRHPQLLNCPNGTVDLRTGQLRPHERGELHSKQTRAMYEPDARSPLLDQFHDTFVPDDERRAFLYRLLGMCLIGGNPYRIFPMLVGPTSTGKSQLATTIQEALGDYAGQAGPSVLRGNLDERPRTDLMNLMQARVAILEEASRTWDLHADQVKRVTGAVPLAARKLYSSAYIQRVPDFTPLVVANTVPMIREADDAVKRRLVAVPFNHSVVKVDDPRIAEVFKADEGVWRALLARMVAGAVEVLREGGLGAFPLDMVDATMEAFEGLDDVADFVRYAVDEGLISYDHTCPSNACIKSSALHSMYTTWIDTHGDATQKRDKVGMKTFSQRLESLGWTKVRSDGMRWIGVKSHEYRIT